MRHLSLYLRLVTIVACLATIFYSCKKSDKGFQLPIPPNITPPPYIMNRLDRDLQQLITSLQRYPQLATAFVRKTLPLGSPYWSKSLYGKRGATFVCLVPLKRDRDSLFNGFIAIESDSALHLKTFDGRIFSTYDPAPGDGSPTRFEINHAMNAFNHYGFGREKYSIAGLHAADLQRLEEVKRAGSLSPAARIPITLNSCYSWSTCMGDGNGNCKGPVHHFSECVTYTIWIPEYDRSDPGDHYPPGEFGGGVGGAPADPLPPNEYPHATVASPAVPIYNIEHHLQCFDRSLPAKMTIYVDQPTPGTTEPVSIMGGIGHAFISFEQQQNGKTVRRTLGFYPDGTVDPFRHTSTTSILGDDAGRWYDVKWETAITAEQLADMLTAVTIGSDTYDIESYNCVNFLLDLTSAGGIYLPRTKGWWFTGRGLNPGNLGEDIRKLPGSDGRGAYSKSNEGNCN